MTQAIIVKREGAYIVAAEGAAVVGSLTAQAKAARDAALASAAAAEAVSGPTYANTTAGLAATTDGDSFAVDNGDGTVTIYLNDSGSAVAQRTLATVEYLASSAGASLIGSFDSAQFDTDEAYSGTGTATSGAPRWYLGNLTPSGDDSALCIGRDVSGDLLFSHAIRDESEFASTGDSAYTSFDAAPTYKSNGGVEYNHGYQFQARPLMSAANGMDLLAPFVSYPRQSAGTIDRLYHFHVQGLNKTGGTLNNQVGFYCSPITGTAGENYAFYAESNPSFFGGYVQLGTTDIFGIRESKQQAGHFTSTISSFVTGGGVFVGGKVTASDYAAIRAYNDDAGATRGLALNYTGGQVLVGAGSPITGEQLEVVGTIGTSESYRVDGVKVVGNQGAAVADATDAASAITQLNALLARCREHGLIAT